MGLLVKIIYLCSRLKTRIGFEISHFVKNNIKPFYVNIKKAVAEEWQAFVDEKLSGDIIEEAIDTISDKIEEALD